MINGPSIGRRRLIQGTVAVAAAAAATQPAPALARNKPDRLLFIGDDAPWHTCLVKEVGPAFEKQTGIKIDFMLLPGSALAARLKAELSAGSDEIDIIQWTPTFAGWLAPYLQDHAKLVAEANAADPNFDWNDFLPAVRNMATWGGVLHGVPYRIVTGILHYQKDLLEKAGFAKPPETFAEFQAAAIALTKAGASVNRYGVGTMARQGSGMIGCWRPFVLAKGGRYYDRKTYEIFINEPNAVEALQYDGDLMTKYKVVQPASLTWSYDGIVAGGQSDLYAMMVMLAPYGTLINDPKLSRTAGKWAWALAPGATSISQTGTDLGGWSLAVPKTARNTEWSFEFIKLATSKKWLRRSMDLGNAAPRELVLHDPHVIKQYGWAPVMGQSLKTAKLDPRQAIYSTLQLALRAGISQVMLGNQTAKQSLDHVAASWHRSMHLAGLV